MKNLSFFVATVALIFSSCSKSTPFVVTPEAITLQHDGTVQINATPADGVSYKSADTFYATVSGSGLVKGERVGKTEIKVSSENGEKNIPVTVSPQYELYPDIDKLLGVPESTIEFQFGPHYQIGNNGGNPMWLYVSYNNVVNRLAFTMENGKVESAMAVVSSFFTTELAKYLIERYSLEMKDGDYYYFLNHDADVAIVLSVFDNNNFGVGYFKRTSSRSTDDLFYIQKELFDSLIIE